MSLLKEQKGFFGRLSEKIGDAVMVRPTIDEELMDDLEEILITSDIGMETSMKIVEILREEIKAQFISRPDQIIGQLKEIITQLIDKGERHQLCCDTPLVLLVVGVNGSGKTTTIGKIANRYKAQGKTVLLAAADTFRAAASEQLAIWGERVDVKVIRHKEGADPSAVIFDAIQSAKAKETDVLICDTAGRLQNKKNLMEELEKMDKTIQREFPEAARETLLILDATTGKNAVSQAAEFNATAGISGIVLTKLDGTAKGGIVITIADELDMAIKFIGLGEGIDDLKEFDPKEFAGGMCDE